MRCYARWPRWRRLVLAGYPLRTAAFAATVLLVGCTVGESVRTGPSAEGSAIPPEPPFAQHPQRGLILLFTPNRRHNLPPPSSRRPEWLPNLPETLSRIPVPDDGFGNDLALSA